jgi:hypothetical protein
VAASKSPRTYAADKKSCNNGIWGVSDNRMTVIPQDNKQCYNLQRIASYFVGK